MKLYKPRALLTWDSAVVHSFNGFICISIKGNPETLYDSVRSKILSLPEDYLLYPAHDYYGLYNT